MGPCLHTSNLQPESFMARMSVHFPVVITGYPLVIPGHLVESKATVQRDWMRRLGMSREQWCGSEQKPRVAMCHADKGDDCAVILRYLHIAA